MYLLWTANPPSITDFLIRFNEYFPFLNKSYDNHSPRLFHFNLTDEETAQLFDTGIKCCDFVDEEMEAQAHGYVVYHQISASCLTSARGE